jgi:L-lysine 2,3-aminomutase
MKMATFPRQIHEKATKCGSGYVDFLKYHRNKHLGKQTGKAERIFEEIARRERLDWADWRTHVRLRLTSISEMQKICPEIAKVLPAGYLDGVKSEGKYRFSLLPINLLDGMETDRAMLLKFIPPREVLRRASPENPDPYGIMAEPVARYSDGTYIGSHKYAESMLVNVETFCPMGCADCYKSLYTRFGERIGGMASSLVEQVSKLVGYLNQHGKVKSVIISGGEPLMKSNDELKEALTLLGNAEHVKEVRVCTGVLQGLPMRINGELLGIFEEFEKSSGKQLVLNVHLSSAGMFSPEMLQAVALARRRGITLNSQIPIQNGVNVWAGDMERSLDSLLKMLDLHLVSGIRPYKFILDMPSSTKAYFVPIEFAIRLWTLLKFSYNHFHPETEMPVSFSAFTTKGNILLTPDMALRMEKRLDSDKGKVAYRIKVPVVAGTDVQWVEETYTEPLLEGINDDAKSLEKTKAEILGH